MSSATPWSTDYPTAQDTGVNAADQQPTLANDSAPAAADGDRVLASQINTLRDKTDAIAKLCGDAFGRPDGSLLNRQPGMYGLGFGLPTGVVAPITLLLDFSISMGASGGPTSISSLGAVALTAAVSSGRLGFCAVEGQPCGVFDGSYYLEIPYDVALDCTGAQTLEIIACPTASPSSYDASMLSYHSGTPWVDSLYDYQSPGLDPNAFTGAVLAGSHNGIATIEVGLSGFDSPEGARLNHYAFTRDLAGTTYTFYRNGRQSGQMTVANPPDLGGAPGTRKLYLFGTPNVDPIFAFPRTWYGAVRSVRLINDVEFTPAQVAESYGRQVVPDFYGLF